MLAPGLEALYLVGSLATFSSPARPVSGCFNAHSTAGNLQHSATELQQRHDPYPTPPLPNTTLIIAITSWQDLLYEGVNMRRLM